MKRRKRFNERIPDAEREKIAQAIRDGGTCRGIAGKFKRSPGTVKNIANEFKIENPFERTQTARATAAKVMDNKARRAQLAVDLLGDAIRLRKQMWEKALVYDFTKDGDYVQHEMAQPTFGDKRAITGSLLSLLRTIAEIEAIDKGVVKVDITATLRQVAEREGLDFEEVQAEADRILSENKL